MTAGASTGPRSTDAVDGPACARIVVVEGEGSAEPASPLLVAHGHVVQSVESMEAALGAIQCAVPDLMVSDMRLLDGSGLSLLESVHRLSPALPVIIVSERPSVPEAVRAMQAGAASYVSRPLGAELQRAVRGALERARARRGQPRTRDTFDLPFRRGLVGDSKPMLELLKQIALVGPTRTTVLLTGETGTGKERIAEALHEASPRRDGPFVAVNCAALTETLLESELFGHEKGSFSGAHTRREGRFEVADGGTVFLDEIGEISPAIQVKLLRVLQQRQFERVGGNETISVDVRIIAATNRDLREMVANRQFRADLYYRLNVMALEVPPLRARRSDVPLLVEHILPRLALELGVPEPVVTSDALAALEGYDWPGNVRELENVLERALVLSQGGEGPLTAETLGPHLSPSWSSSLEIAGVTTPGPKVPGASFAEIERHAIMTTYEACGRSPRRTAEILGLSPRTVHYRLREYRGEPGRRARRLDGATALAERSPGGALDDTPGDGPGREGVGVRGGGGGLDAA